MSRSWWKKHIFHLKTFSQIIMVFHYKSSSKHWQQEFLLSVCLLGFIIVKCLNSIDEPPPLTEKESSWRGSHIQFLYLLVSSGQTGIGIDSSFKKTYKCLFFEEINGKFLDEHVETNILGKCNLPYQWIKDGYEEIVQNRKELYYIGIV